MGFFFIAIPNKNFVNAISRKHHQICNSFLQDISNSFHWSSYTLLKNASIRLFFLNYQLKPLVLSARIKNVTFSHINFTLTSILESSCYNKDKLQSKIQLAGKGTKEGCGVWNMMVILLWGKKYYLQWSKHVRLECKGQILANQSDYLKKPH